MPLRYLVLILLCAACASPPLVEPVSTEPQGDAEIRAVWITNVDSDVLFSEQGIVDAVARLDEAGFNVLFPVVWNKGMTLYPSDVAERTIGIRIDTTLIAGHDPLAIMLREGKRYGMKVIPWFEFGFASSYNEGGGHILRMYPDWAARDIDGGLLTKNNFEWMNGLHPDVQDFLLGMIDEVLTNYDVDGIQGDDRLPAMPSHGGYSEYSVGLYRSDHGGAMPPDDPRDPAFVQWKADKLSDFGGRLYDAVKSHGSDKIVSLSPSIYPWSHDEYLQDWPDLDRARTGRLVASAELPLLDRTLRIDAGRDDSVLQHGRRARGRRQDGSGHSGQGWSALQRPRLRPAGDATPP